MTPAALKLGWTYDDFGKDTFITSYLDTSVREYPFNPRAFTRADLSMQAIELMVEDCRLFKDQAIGDIKNGTAPALPDTDAMARAGGTFWRVRNDPRFSFSSFTWKAPHGERLTKLARSFGKCRLFVGHDRLIYVSTDEIERSAGRRA